MTLPIKIVSLLSMNLTSLTLLCKTAKHFLTISTFRRSYRWSTVMCIWVASCAWHLLTKRQASTLPWSFRLLNYRARFMLILRKPTVLIQSSLINLTSIWFLACWQAILYIIRFFISICLKVLNSLASLNLLARYWLDCWVALTFLATSMF